MDIQTALVTAGRYLITGFLDINPIGLNIGKGLPDLDRTGLLIENFGLN